MSKQPEKKSKRKQAEPDVPWEYPAKDKRVYKQHSKVRNVELSPEWTQKLICTTAEEVHVYSLLCEKSGKKKRYVYDSNDMASFHFCGKSIASFVPQSISSCTDHIIKHHTQDFINACKKAGQGTFDISSRLFRV